MTRLATENEKLVFGYNVQIDPVTDKPIEMGHGAKNNQTPSHLAALERMKKLEDAVRGGVTAKEIAEIVRAIVNPPENMTADEKAADDRRKADEAAADVAVAAKDQEIADLKAQLAAATAQKAETPTPEPQF